MGTSPVHGPLPSESPWHFVCTFLSHHLSSTSLLKFDLGASRFSLLMSIHSLLSGFHVPGILMDAGGWQGRGTQGDEGALQLSRSWTQPWHLRYVRWRGALQEDERRLYQEVLGPHGGPFSPQDCRCLACKKMLFGVKGLSSSDIRCSQCIQG